MTNAQLLAIMQHLYQNANMAGVGDATGLRGSSTAGNLIVHLHTADPGANAANKVVYAEYSGVSIPRSAAGFDVALVGDKAVVSNAAVLTFPKRETDGAVQRASHFSFCLDDSTVLASAPLTSQIDIGLNNTPTCNIGQLVADASRA
jgi:hypothetical protein